MFVEKYQFLFLSILFSIKIERLLFLKILKILAFFDSYFWPFNKTHEKIIAIFVISAIMASIWNVFIKFRWHDEKLTLGFVTSWGFFYGDSLCGFLMVIFNCTFSSQPSPDHSSYIYGVFLWGFYMGISYKDLYWEFFMVLSFSPNHKNPVWICLISWYNVVVMGISKCTSLLA